MKSRTDVAEQLGDMVERAPQSKEALEKMSAAASSGRCCEEGFTMTKPEQFWEMVEKPHNPRKLLKNERGHRSSGRCYEGEGFTMTKPDL
jgi:hypothetical protein